jgi:phage host-nuclease inhibitor protein Gam
MTKDIPINPASATQIDTLDGLKGAVHRLASLQLTLNAAEAQQQATIEAAKRAFDQATTEIQQEIANLLAGVEAFCAANKDMLFPVKGRKRAKTFSVLQHALAYRESSSIEAPANILDCIKLTRSHIKQLMETPGLEIAAEAQAQIDALDQLIRTKEEFDRTAAKPLLEAHPGLMSRLQIREVKSDTFRVTFNFTPTA